MIPFYPLHCRCDAYYGGRFHLLQDSEAVNDEKEFFGLLVVVVCRLRKFGEVIQVLEHWAPSEMKRDLCVMREVEDQNAVAV